MYLVLHVRPDLRDHQGVSGGQLVVRAHALSVLAPKVVVAWRLGSRSGGGLRLASRLPPASPTLALSRTTLTGLLGNNLFLEYHVISLVTNSILFWCWLLTIKDQR